MRSVLQLIPCSCLCCCQVSLDPQTGFKRRSEVAFGVLLKGVKINGKGQRLLAQLEALEDSTLSEFWTKTSASPVPPASSIILPSATVLSYWLNSNSSRNCSLQCQMCILNLKISSSNYFRYQYSFIMLQSLLSQLMIYFICTFTPEGRFDITDELSNVLCR